MQTHGQRDVWANMNSQDLPCRRYNKIVKIKKNIYVYATLVTKKRFTAIIVLFLYFGILDNIQPLVLIEDRNKNLLTKNKRSMSF